MSDSSRKNCKMVTGLFTDDDGVDRAYRACVERGYEIGDVNVVMSERTRKRYISDDSELHHDLASHKAEGGELGGPTGGGVGIALAASAAVGAVVALPVLGFVVVGPIAVSLLAAGAAGVTAGLIGLLGDWGVPDDRLKQYEAGIREGGILMMVETRSEEDAAHIQTQWNAIGGRDVFSCTANA